MEKSRQAVSVREGEGRQKKDAWIHKNSKDFDPDKQEAFDMTVMRTYDELDSEKMILDALYEDYAILKEEFKPISALESKEREIHKYRKQVGDLLLKISNELQYVENKDFINASYLQLDQKKLNLLFFRLNIKPTKKSRTLSFLSNAYKESRRTAYRRRE